MPVFGVDRAAAIPSQTRQIETPREPITLDYTRPASNLMGAIDGLITAGSDLARLTRLLLGCFCLSVCSWHSITFGARPGLLLRKRSLGGRV